MAIEIPVLKCFPCFKDRMYGSKHPETVFDSAETAVTIVNGTAMCVYHASTVAENQED